MYNQPKHNSNIHHRKSIRLKGYDYSQAGAYFITICCDDRICRFGEIVVGTGLAPAQMILNEFGQIAYNEWIKLSERFANFELDVFQIMPNHIHGIIVLNDVGAGFTPAQYHENEKGQPQEIARTQNDAVDVNMAGASPAPTMGKLWQRNYHEHIIRNEQSYETISNYIINNPAKWSEDKFYNNNL